MLSILQSSSNKVKSIPSSTAKRSPDTDMFVMLLAHSSSFQFQVLFETDNNRQLLNIKHIAVAMGSR